MTFEQLTYFLAAAENSNFSKAADRLFVHHTTVSRSVANLEEEFGTLLFTRKKYSLELTEFGKLFQKEAHALIDRYHTMDSRMRRAAKALSGRLAICCPRVYFQALVPAYRGFNTAHPNVTFSVSDSRSSYFDEALHAVLNFECDLGIVFSTGYPYDNTELDSLCFYREEEKMIVPENHPFTTGGSVTISKLQGEKLVAAEYMGERFLSQLSARLQEANALHPDNPNTLRMISRESDLLLTFETTQELTFLPARLMLDNRWIGSGNAGELLWGDPIKPAYKYVNVTDIDCGFDVLLIWHKDNNNPALPLFLNIVWEHLGKR